MAIFLFVGWATDTLIPAVALPLSLLITFVAMRLPAQPARGDEPAGDVRSVSRSGPLLARLLKSAE